MRNISNNLLPPNIANLFISKVHIHFHNTRSSSRGENCVRLSRLDKQIKSFSRNKNCQILVKNLNFVTGMTQRFVSAKRLIRYFSNSSKLLEHGAQSLVREIKMLAVWPSITEGFPTACSRIICNKNLSNNSTCEEFKFFT